MLKFLLLFLYLSLSFGDFVDKKGNWLIYALNFHFQLTPSKKLSLKKYNKSKKSTSPVIQTKRSHKALATTPIQTKRSHKAPATSPIQTKKSYKPPATTLTKKSYKAPAASLRALSSTSIQAKIDKYQQALLLLCAQEINSKEKFLSFTQNINNLRQFIKNTIQNFSALKEEDKIILSRMENYIDKEALPIQKILKEPGSFEEKASTLKHFFEIHYRNHHRIPETQTIFKSQASSKALPKAIFETLACISEPI